MISHNISNHDKYFYGFLILFTAAAGLFVYVLQSV